MAGAVGPLQDTPEFPLLSSEPTPFTVLKIAPIENPGLFHLESSLPSLNYQLKSRSRIGNQFFYVLVVLQLAISVGSLLGSQSLRSGESAVLEERATLTSYRSQLDRLQTQMGGAQATGAGSESRRAFATILSSSLRALASTTPAGFETDSHTAAQQAEAFRQLATRLVFDTRWIADYDQELSEAARSLGHERALADAAEADFMGQAPAGAKFSRKAYRDAHRGVAI